MLDSGDGYMSVHSRILNLVVHPYFMHLFCACVIFYQNNPFFQKVNGQISNRSDVPDERISELEVPIMFHREVKRQRV